MQEGANKHNPVNPLPPKYQISTKKQEHREKKKEERRVWRHGLVSSSRPSYPRTPDDE
jgi:hypothetical protein